MSVLLDSLDWCAQFALIVWAFLVLVPRSWVDDTGPHEPEPPEGWVDLRRIPGEADDVC